MNTLTDVGTKIRGAYTEKEVINNVLKFHESYNKSIKGVGKIAELRLSGVNAMDLSIKKMKQMSKKVNDTLNAKESGSIRSLFKNVTIKAGKKFFSKQNGEYSEPAELQTFSTTVEVPVGEFIDPIFSVVNRLFWREYTYPL